MSDERYQLSTGDYLALDATAMAAAVKTGELTPGCCSAPPRRAAMR